MVGWSMPVQSLKVGIGVILGEILGFTHVGIHPKHKPRLRKWHNFSAVFTFSKHVHELPCILVTLSPWHPATRWRPERRRLHHPLPTTLRNTHFNRGEGMLWSHFKHRLVEIRLYNYAETISFISLFIVCYLLFCTGGPYKKYSCCKISVMLLQYCHCKQASAKFAVDFWQS